MRTTPRWRNKERDKLRDDMRRATRAGRESYPCCIKCRTPMPQDFCYKCYRLEHREKLLANDRRPSNRYRLTQRAAKTREVPFSISIDDYTALIGLPCHYCCGPLNKTGSGLDRKDNVRGYVTANVVPCCGPCNIIKNKHLTYEEMIAAMGAVVALRKKKLE